jgi:hemerythrin superfamily protein
MKILRITTHWSAEEAEYIYQLLDEFKDVLWQSYGEDILEMHKTRQLEKQNRDKLADFNNDPLF